MDNPATGVMARLKTETWPQHQAAETSDFQRRLAKGEVDVEGYGQWLGQMLLVHRALETRLRDAAARDPRIARVVTEEQYQEPYLLADLQHFGVDTKALTPLPGTRGLIDRLASASPLEILGMHYVLEGSNNGNRFIVRAVRKALDLSEGHGDRYLDPYGESQREKWAAFKREMDAATWSAGEADALVAAAKAMFSGIGAISADLHAATS